MGIYSLIEVENNLYPLAVSIGKSNSCNIIESVLWETILYQFWTKQVLEKLKNTMADLT